MEKHDHIQGHDYERDPASTRAVAMLCAARSDLSNAPRAAAAA